MTWPLSFSSLLLLPTLLVATSAVQVRDATIPGRPEPSGSGLIRGTIVTDDTPPRPVRRVVITITEAASAIAARVVTSDEEGRFTFDGLPSGRYSITASKAPYLLGAYGAARVAGPGSVQTGTAIALADGQRVEGRTITLIRGAVITGTLRDPDGQPARIFAVGVWYPRRDANGQLALTTYRSTRTDDRGVFRLYGLPPGAYYVVGSVASPGEAVALTDEDIRRVLDQQDRTATPAPPPRRPSVGYAPAYFPGTPDLAQAVPVTVGAAEERSGVDFQVQFVPMARLDGVLTNPDGKPRNGVQIAATSHVPTVTGTMGGPGLRATTDAQGRFSLTALAPGAYSIDARVQTQGGQPSLWARADVVMAGVDQTADLSLRPGLTVSGRVTFDAQTLVPPTNLTKTRISLTPVGLPAGASVNTTGAQLDANGAFTLSGVTPGRYQLTATLPVPSLESGWYLASATIQGQESLEGPVEIRATDLDIESAIRLTDRPTEISGTISDTEGRPAPEYFLIVFAASESDWKPYSRRIMHTRPSHDGAYAFRNLPPGAYRVAAVTQIDQGQWFDPDFLRQLVPASAPVTLVEHGKVRQDLRVAR